MLFDQVPRVEDDPRGAERRFFAPLIAARAGGYPSSPARGANSLVVGYLAEAPGVSGASSSIHVPFSRPASAAGAAFPRC